ncbi:hypothetical protein MMC25_002524 [Agyrium rufum]|nr:hypothetical protein [Agyrium rufum]
MNGSYRGILRRSFLKDDRARYEFYYDVILRGQYTFRLRDLHAKYGPIVRINPYELHVSDSTFYEKLYATSASGEKREKWGWYTKQFLTPLSMFSTVGHDHHRMRRAALNKFFSLASVRRLQPLEDEKAGLLVQRMKESMKQGEPIKMNIAFAAFTNDVIMEYAYGYSDHCLDQPNFGPAYHDAANTAGKLGSLLKQMLFIAHVLLACPERMVAYVSSAFSLVIRLQRKVKKHVIQVKSEDPSTYQSLSHPTLFHALLQSNLPSSEKTVPRLKDEAWIVVGAGTLTTAWALSVALYHLLASPRILSRLKAELKAAIPDRDSTPLVRELEQLPYLHAVVQEALRLSYGVCSRMQRISPDEIMMFTDRGSGKTWAIPAGTPVSMTSTLVHHDETVFPDSTTFRPERWLENPRLDRYLVSFSKGSRMCLGINMAYSEMYICLAAIFRRFGSVGKDAGAGKYEVRDEEDEGVLELYGTDEGDVKIVADGFVPLVKKGSEGIRLLHRSIGHSGPHSLQKAENARLLHYLSAAPSISFDGDVSTRRNDSQAPATQAAIDVQRGSVATTSRQVNESKKRPHADVVPEASSSNELATAAAVGDVDPHAQVWAHRAGVNALAIDRFEGRYLISGGADSSILCWDLENDGGLASGPRSASYDPIASARRSTSTNRYGITHLSFYPFDSLAFLSSSYDHTLKLHATETPAQATATFDLSAVVYSHAVSPIASHLLVACATQAPAVRLVDLRSGAATHSLAGHTGGAVLSVDWSPRHEHVLASAGSDGAVRLWDVRRSAGSLGVLDLDNSVGFGRDGVLRTARSRDRGRAHTGACNGVVWTDDGNYLVTAGHDEHVRVWDASVGANTLAHFGPTLKNALTSTLLPLIVPSIVSGLGSRVMFYPHEREILMFDLFEGTALKRLKVQGVDVAQASRSQGQRNIRHRVTSLAWRAGHVGMYSAHSDGRIRAWTPLTPEDIAADEKAAAEAAEQTQDEDGERQRKRQALAQIYRDLTTKPITFT